MTATWGKVFIPRSIYNEPLMACCRASRASPIL